MAEKKRELSLKKFLVIFAAALLAATLFFMLFNLLTDPFGVFGDPLMDWYDYNMTNNPRVAKIAYLDEHYENYDSYIIGCSKTGSFDTEKLNEYYGGASFYNMLMYGGDMYDILETARYVIGNYDVENIIISIGLEEAVSYNGGGDDVKTRLHSRVDGSSDFLFYLRYLTLNPRYGIDKLQSEDSYLPSASDVFIAGSGLYNKLFRDTEPIGSLSAYEESYPDFGRTYGFNGSLAAMEECLAAVGEIKGLCDQLGVSFRLVATPIYCEELRTYRPEDLAAYWERLAEITDFWDFSGYTALSYDARYFYDAYHFRNAVGDMALARMFGDESVYIPQDFGTLVTAENVHERTAYCFEDSGGAEENSRAVPILLYHHIGYEEGNEAVITPERFEEQVAALAEAGYTAIFFDELVDYVYQGNELPEKPVVITFDDGYASNLEIAAPILERYGLRAVVNVIGVSVGKDTYKDTGQPIYAHFSYDEAGPWVGAGVLDIQSHSFDMHRSERYDEDYRSGVLRKEGESEQDYIAAFCGDYLRSKESIESALGGEVYVFAYPQGYRSELSAALLYELGCRVTLYIDPGVSVVTKGLPQSLLGLPRLNMTESVTPEAMLSMLGD